MQSEPEPGRRAPDSSWLHESAPRPVVPMPVRPGTVVAPVIPLRPASDDLSGLATAAFILGISSVFLALAGACDLPFGITGFVLGLTGLRSSSRHHLAVAGTTLAGIGILLSLAATLVWLFIFGAFR